MQEDTPFFLASIDKLINASIALRLSETGQLDLDAPLSSCLPSQLTAGIHRMGSVDYSDQITVRHLLGHATGLPDWLEDRPRGGRSLTERLLTEGDMALNFDDIASLLRDDLSPHFPPQNMEAKRHRIRYSDTNFMLLIAVIEALTQHPLSQVYEDMLLRPLDLRATWMPGWSQPLDPAEEPAVLRAAGRALEIPLLIRSVRGVYSTARDAIAFLRSLVEGRLFDDPGTVAAMRQCWSRFGFPTDRAALRSPGWPIEYGLGIMRFRLPRMFTPWRPMPSVVGHTGSTGCWLFYCEELDVFLCGSVDEVTAGAVPYRVVPRILRVVASGS
jgi:CubicO group peptidase (beta-lactamase class C family)